MTQKQTVTVTATSDSTSNPPLITTASFDLTFLDACSDSSLVTITPTTQMTPSANSYDGQTLTFIYNQFTVTPSWCEMTVTCVGVTGPSDKL